MHTSNNNIQKWNAEHGSGPGRSKGSPNKVTTRIKEAFALLLEQRMDNLGEMIDRIAVDDPKAAVDLIVRISERFVPKLTQTSLTNGDGGPIDIKFEFGKKIDDTETKTDFDIENL
jgi:hypothetical protein